MKVRVKLANGEVAEVDFKDELVEKMKDVAFLTLYKFRKEALDVEIVDNEGKVIYSAKEDWIKGKEEVDNWLKGEKEADKNV